MSAMNWRSPSSIKVSIDGGLIANIWRGTSTGAIGAVPMTALTLSNLYRGNVIASEAKQSMSPPKERMDCLASLAMTEARSEHPSRYLVHHHLVGNAAQRRLFLDRLDGLPRQDRGQRRRIDDRAGDVDLLRGRQALHPGCDIDGLAEIILPLVEHHRQARALVDSDLDDQILGAARDIEHRHRGPHPKPRGQRVLGPDEGRHYGIADSFDHRAFFRRDDFQQRVEMRAHQIESG